jgi:hypothetical protein
MDKTKLMLIALPFLFVFALVRSGIESNYRKRMLKGETYETIAVFSGRVNPYRGAPGSFFTFEVNGKQHESFSDEQGLGFLKEGDSVRIKYSVQDPDIIKVLDACYLKKHKGKCVYW